MEIYNQDKSKILENYDLSLGKLVEDTLIIHHNAIEGVEEQGHYETLREYPNGGKDVKWVVDVKGVEPKEAYDEIKNILVYVPYTNDELKEIKINQLREQRKPLLEAFDKYRSAVSYGIVNETSEEHQAILTWYNNLLDLDTQTLNTKEAIPPKIAYYL